MAAKRHHYLPRFYLRGFADHRQRVRRYSRDAAKPVVMSVENAAVECGFYAYVDAAGEKQEHVEELLATIEHQAARALRRMVDQRAVPPNREDRAAIAIFLALQIMRTPEQRRQLAALADFTEKLMLRGIGEQEVRERLGEAGAPPSEDDVRAAMDVVTNLDDYRFEPHSNEHIRLMLNVAMEIAPLLMTKTWLLGIVQAPEARGLITGDRAVIAHTPPERQRSGLGIGLDNAEGVYFPIDRQHLLCLARPEDIDRAYAFPLLAPHVEFAQHLVARACFRWVFQHPDEPDISSIVPTEPRPLMVVSGEEIFDAR